jgi:HK97 family phage portal protein
MAGLLRRLAAALRPEKRDFAGGFATGIGIGFSGTSSGNTYAQGYMAEQASTIVACVSLIAATISALPAFVYRRDGAGRVEAPQHPVARLLKQPNDRLSWNDLCEWIVSQFLLHGNALCIVESDGAGQATSLIPIPWQYVLPRLIPGSNRLAFDILQLGPWGGTGMPIRRFDNEVFLVRERSDDGYLGRSRISRAPMTIQNALGIGEYSSAIWKNAATPSGAITHPGKLNREARLFLSEQFTQAYSGSHNSKKTVLLDEGMSFTPFSVSPEDAEVLASRRFSTEECARLMGVPPPLVGIWDHSSFGSPASAAAWFGTFTILPIVRKIEAEFARTVFADQTGPYHLELDMTGLMRADPVAQQASNIAAVAAGVMTINEARFDLGLNPLPAAAAPLDGAIPGAEP